MVEIYIYNEANLANQIWQNFGLINKHVRIKMIKVSQHARKLLLEKKLDTPLAFAGKKCIPGEQSILDHITSIIEKHQNPQNKRRQRNNFYNNYAMRQCMEDDKENKDEDLASKANRMLEERQKWNKQYEKTNKSAIESLGDNVVPRLGKEEAMIANRNKPGSSGKSQSLGRINRIQGKNGSLLGNKSEEAMLLAKLRGK